MTYPVVEIFYSLQGEGAFSGAAAFFVRLYGCPVKCPWCDTKESWQKNPQIQNLQAEEIAAQASLSSCEFAVITGGEPTIHDLKPLVDAFHKYEIPVHLETSGVTEKVQDFDWITLSPKLHFPPTKSFLEAADELKFVVARQDEISSYLEDFEDFIPLKNQVFFTPESSQVTDKALVEELCETIKLRGKPFRVSLQLHKILDCK